jgi:hypothetical protein
MNWHDAYLTQAWSDFQIFREMNSSRYPNCHALHYLQMATEKIAKGFMSKRSLEPPRKLTHYSLVNFLKASKSQPDWREKLGYGHNFLAYGSYIDSLLPIAGQIEKLVPEGVDRINTEYPWINGEGDVDCPCKCDFAFIDKSDLTKFRDLIHRLFQIVGFQD